MASELAMLFMDDNMDHDVSESIDTASPSVTARRNGLSAIPWGSWLLGLATALLYFIAAIVRVRIGSATTWDLGYFSQVLWLIGHGHWLAQSTLNGHLALTDAGSAILYPVGWIYPYIGPTGILLLQSAALASGIPFLSWWLDRYGLRGNPLYWGTLVLYTVYPAILGPALFDWHPDTLAVPALFYAAWAIETQRHHHFWTAVALVLLTKVTATLTVMGLAVTLAVKRRWHMAIGAFMVGFAAAVGEVDVLFPLMTGHTMSQWVQNYSWLGPTPKAGAVFLLTHIWVLVTILANAHGALYLWTLLVPIGIIPAFAGLWRQGWAYPAWITILFNGLSSFLPQANPFNQYSVSVAPFLFICLIVVLPKMALKRTLLYSAGLMVTAIGSLTLWFSGERPLVWYATPSSAALRAAAAIIPPTTPVYGQNATLVEVANRANIRFLPVPPSVSVGTFVFLDLNVNPINRISSTALVKTTLTRLRTHSLEWRPLFHQNGVWVFEKR